MTIGNRFEMIDFQSLLSQDVLNVYFYRQISGVAGDALDLANVFTTDVLPLITAVQWTGHSHLGVGVKNLDVPTDFAFVPYVPAVAGALPGEAAPRMVAWAFRLNRQQTDIRHGAKRIAGVTTGSINAGEATAAITPALANLASKMDDNLTGASAAIYEPRIMRRLLDPTGHLIGYQDFPMGIAQYVRVSTQNTRKVGVGS